MPVSSGKTKSGIHEKHFDHGNAMFNDFASLYPGTVKAFGPVLAEEGKYVSKVDLRGFFDRLSSHGPVSD